MMNLISGSKSLTDDIELWIDVGMPDEKRIRKASNRADKAIYTYGGRNKFGGNKFNPNWNALII